MNRKKHSSHKDRVLIVEDELSIRTNLSVRLRNEGFQVSLAEDWTEAVEAQIQNRPEIVILDLNLPGVPGENLASYFQRDCNIPVVIYSAYVDRTELAELSDASAFVPKTAPYEYLTAVLKSCLSAARQKQCV
ncbi:MAG: response regulator [Candidatus Lindowbacteria bacterium]|nr:response regulator [Candidatus Lindowbacteria bacterium]